MQVTTTRWERDTGWSQSLSEIGHPVHLQIFFASRDLIELPQSPWKDLLAAHPEALCLGCSTAGEISDSRVVDHSITVALIGFATVSVRSAIAPVSSGEDSRNAGAALARDLEAPGLRHVWVLCDGTTVNGTALIRGLREKLPASVQITGGLAGDGSRFESTCIVRGPEVRRRHVLGLGFYGDDLVVSHGFAGGWTPFGPKRLITHSVDNVLYTLDDQPALNLYKRYLGERSVDLPATGLLFPLQLLPDRTTETGTVRTILAIDEAQQSLTFAGDMPRGSYVRLMKASADELIEGADHAAAQSALPTTTEQPHFAFLVSCVGRRLVMGQRVDEEVEATLKRLQPGTKAIGFYSYGQISTGCPSPGCELHNQTMTLTLLAETLRK